MVLQIDGRVKVAGQGFDQGRRQAAGNDLTQRVVEEVTYLLPRLSPT